MKAALNLIRLPNLFMIAFCQVLVQGFLLASEPGLPAVLNTRFFLLVLSTVLVAAAGYIINDYYDTKIDAINKPKRLVVGKDITRRKAMFAHLVLTGIGVVIGGLLSWKIGLVHLSSALLLWGYSATLKRMPVIGNAVISLLTAVMLLVVALFTGSDNPLVWGYAVFAFLLTMIREIIKDMEDVKGDAVFECRTLPIVAGIPRTKMVLYVFIAVFIALLLLAVFQFRQNMFFGFYMMLLVVAPTLLLLYQLVHADRRKDFARLSRLCKIIMFAGIVSMPVLVPIA